MDLSPYDNPICDKPKWLATFESKLSIKLLIDIKARKVLFAEAEKDTVDFLFSHSIIASCYCHDRLLKRKRMNYNLYDSVENMNDTYIQSNQRKDMLLNPTSSAGIISSVPLLLLNDCSLSTPADGAVAATKGFVKEVVTYMVMDDLLVMPMSTISSITLLNKFNVKDVGALQEEVVHFGMEELLIVTLNISIFEIPTQYMELSGKQHDDSVQQLIPIRNDQDVNKIVASTLTHLSNKFETKSDQKGGTSVKSCADMTEDQGGAGLIPSNEGQIESSSYDICAKSCHGSIFSCGAVLK
ncbi:hypothetical protein HAX54_012309 [Datura stramonium]|uniref:Uncharacterized protein n=1 Tax=Datura stramonium TaxID=4076 RepID=A0ABS8TLE4_DATST|nr:hypothetical protein [Datura stramonium]